MKLKEIKKICETFESMEAAEQWQWLLDIDLKQNFIITLDNDSTSIWFDRYDADADYLMYFKSDIGSREGASFLLESIGCRVEYA